MTTKQAIEHVLSGSKKPMRVPEIIAAGVPLTNLKGATPGQTFYSILYAENKKPDGLVVQVERGTFKLNPKRRKADAKAPAKAASSKAKAAPAKRRGRTVKTSLGKAEPVKRTRSRKASTGRKAPAAPKGLLDVTKLDQPADA
jgi:hypothetical protein